MRRQTGMVGLMVLLLSGCASTSGVVPIGSETYMISRSQKGFDITGSRVKSDAIIEANAYCRSQGKMIVLTKTNEQDMKPFRADAQAEIEFKCAP